MDVISSYGCNHLRTLLSYKGNDKMKRVLLVSVFLVLIFIQIGYASEIRLTEFIWIGNVYVAVSSPLDVDLALELQGIIRDRLERISELKDEWGQSIYSGVFSINTNRRTFTLQFKIKITGMFTVEEVDFWQEGMISRHAIDLCKTLIETVSADLEAHEAVSDSYPLLGKVWPGNSFWEPCDPWVKIWYPDKYYEDLVRILEYRNGEFYRDYYKHTISSDPTGYFIALTLITVVVIIGLMKKRK